MEHSATPIHPNGYFALNASCHSRVHPNLWRLFHYFSRIAKLASFRSIISFDFNDAYLFGELDKNEKVYMQSSLAYDSNACVVKRLQSNMRTSPRNVPGFRRAGLAGFKVFPSAIAFKVDHLISVALQGVINPPRFPNYSHNIQLICSHREVQNLHATGLADLFS